MEGIKIEIAQHSQTEALVDYLVKHFLREEPITKAADFTIDEAREFFGELVAEGMKTPVSFVALNEKNEIVACRLNEIVDLNQKGEHNGDNGRKHPESVLKVLNFIELLAKDVDKLLPPGTKRLMKFVVVSVHPGYQRRGIAKELIERSMKLALEQECEYVCATASAVKSQEMFKKLDFQFLRNIDHKDYRDPITNEQILKCDDGTLCGKLVAKKLR